MSQDSEQLSKKQKTMVTVNDQDPKFPPQEAPYLKVFTAPTTNGRKVTIFLELLGIEYTFRPTEYLKETKEEWYLKINPNGKVPVVSRADAQGKLFNLAESGAILLYLAENYDTEHKYSYPTSSNHHWEEVEFLFYHASGLNVAQFTYNKAKASGDASLIESAKAGVLKSYQLVEDQLKANGSGYLVGDHISLADVFALPHADQFKNGDVDTTGLPLFEKWVDTLKALPAVQAAYEKK